MKLIELHRSKATTLVFYNKYLYSGHPSILFDKMQFFRIHLNINFSI